MIYHNRSSEMGPKKNNIYIYIYVLGFLDPTLFLSPAFSKKSGGTLFLVFRGAWRVVRGSEFLVGTLSP